MSETEISARRAGKNLRLVEQFNQVCPVGTTVLYWPGERSGEGRKSTTRSEAWLLGGHTPVVMVDGYAGGIALSHVMGIPVEHYRPQDGVNVTIANLERAQQYATTTTETRESAGSEPLLAARESAAAQPEAGLSDEERASIRLAVNMLRTGGYPSVYRAVERILAARAASYADQPAECEEDVDDYTMCACGKPLADPADQPAEGGDDRG